MKNIKRTKQDSSVSFYSRIKEYECILKSGGFLYGGVTIYGNDKSLVIVTMDGIGESIKYIELKNVRAVLIKRLSMVPRAVVLALALSAILVLMYLGIGEFSSGFVIASLILILFFVLLFLGVKNCSLRIVTDVNDHLISSVHKYRIAKKLLDFVAERMSPYLKEIAETAEPIEGVESVDSLEIEEETYQ